VWLLMTLLSMSVVATPALAASQLPCDCSDPLAAQSAAQRFMEEDPAKTARIMECCALENKSDGFQVGLIAELYAAGGDHESAVRLLREGMAAAREEDPSLRLALAKSLGAMQDVEAAIATLAICFESSAPPAHCPRRNVDRFLVVGFLTKLAALAEASEPERALAYAEQALDMDKQSRDAARIKLRLLAARAGASGPDAAAHVWTVDAFRRDVLFGSDVSTHARAILDQAVATDAAFAGLRGMEIGLAQSIATRALLVNCKAWR
jgi:tetratricopeptide (TPR) repeat protein